MSDEQHSINSAKEWTWVPGYWLTVAGAAMQNRRHPTDPKRGDGQEKYLMSKILHIDCKAATFPKMNPSPLEEQGPPPSYDAGPQPESLPPLTGVNRSADSTWPSAAREKEQQDDEDNEADEYGPSGTAYSFGGAARTRGGYTAIPIDQGQDDDARGSVDGAMRDDFPARARQGHSVRVDAQETWVQDPEQLFRFVLGERPILPPSIKLRFTFARGNSQEAVSAPLERPWTKVFSFTIPVEIPAFRSQTAKGNGRGTDKTKATAVEAEFDESPNTGLLRAVEDSVPCLRSSGMDETEPCYDHSERKNSRMLSSRTSARVRVLLDSANVRVTDANFNRANIVPGAKADVKVTEKMIVAWNLIRKRGLKEPWCGAPQHAERDAGASSAPVGSDAATMDTMSPSAPTLHSSPEVQTASREAVRKTLAEFAATPIRKGKIMVFDRVPFGWDLSALEDAIQRRVIDQLPQHHDDGPITRVFVTYKEMDPWLELQVVDTKKRIILPMDAGAKKAAIPASLAGLLPLIAISFGVAIGFATAKSLALRVVSWLFWFLFGVFVVLGITGLVSSAGYTISDTVMLAHPLKAWQHTNYPSSFSRAEVVRELLGPAADEGGKASELQLSRRADGWYVLRGVREGDWLQDHLVFLNEVVRLRKSGDLSEALADYHERRTAHSATLEEDDATGL